MSQSGKVQRGEDCTANLPPSLSHWETRRLVFNQAVLGTPYIQPSVLTDITTAKSDYDDPAMANVLLYNVATVQDLPIPTAQTDPLAVQNNSFASQVTNSPIAPLSVAARGYANPQYRVIFKVGDHVTAEVWVDGNCVLSLPAGSVQVQAFSQELLVPATANGVIAGGNVIGGSVVQALCSVGIQWGKGFGVSGPQGMATYTQIGLTDGLNPVQFKRPPFARRVVAIPPLAVAGVFQFDLQNGTPLVAPPVLANSVQQPQDIPHAAFSLSFVPTALSTGEFVVVIWELGVS